ncbi:Cof-type HAD-IIB family hydrolase [Microbacterium aquimaris]|uniref:Cof-type HAD-IIB family hydrolase n=1 Tax=Microbacterium aquimaris TaxID=459816 RepID=UPI002AD3D519|nr:Cof-type HAD-IIB family hydrolase [Microbacterium aquimaris]MDZ8274891.1 Cof-type HAD-IIB family hydrolase [Microbacterium aquimaris]
MTFPAADLRLIAVDMDGTLLDGEGRIPDTLWPLLERLRERGIHFAPASGRQLATLQEAFSAHRDELVFIAENGAHVVSAGVEVSSDALDPVFVASLLDRLRALAAERDFGVVLCGKRSAYIERPDEAFRAEADRYYAKLELVEDLAAVDDQIVKIAVYDFVEAADLAARIDDLRETHQVVVSGHHWTDVMNQGVNKGVALGRLQESLGVTAAHTAVFGDYLNDLEMMDAADMSFAMANAHPDVAARARHRAPANTEHGVITTIERLLG